MWKRTSLRSRIILNVVLILMIVVVGGSVMIWYTYRLHSIFAHLIEKDRADGMVEIPFENVPKNYICIVYPSFFGQTQTRASALSMGVAHDQCVYSTNNHTCWARKVTVGMHEKDLSPYTGWSLDYTGIK